MSCCHLTSKTLHWKKRMQQDSQHLSSETMRQPSLSRPGSWKPGRVVHIAGLLLWLAILCPLVSAGWRHKGLPVCVIGAGPGGITAASELQGKGYRVVLLEKNDYIGGRTKSFRYTDGTYYDVGAIIVANDYYNVLALAKRLGIPAIVDDTENIYYDPITGQAIAQASLSAQAGPAGAAAAVSALTTYVRLWSTWKISQGEPAAEYAVPIAQYMAANNMTALTPVALAVNYFGYGSIYTTPMVYMFRLVTASVISDMILNPSAAFGMLKVPGGFQTLMQKWAATLEDVRLNIKIRKVTRKDSGRSKIYYTVGKSKREKVLRCRATVVAFPQYLPRLSFIELDKNEIALFSQVKLSGYSSAVVDLGAELRAKLAKPGTAAYFANLNVRGSFKPTLTEPPGMGEPTTIVVRKGYPFSVIYSWTSNFTNANAAVNKNKMLSIVPRVVPFPTPPINAFPLPPSSIKAFYEWDYFPHARQQSIAAGFDKALESLQGHKGTYWVGALVEFDDVEATIRSTKIVIENHF